MVSHFGQHRGTREPNGELAFSGDIAEPIPHDLFHKLDKQLAELPLRMGECVHRDRYATFYLAFSTRRK